MDRLKAAQQGIIDAGPAAGSALLVGRGRELIFENYAGIARADGTPADETTLWHMYSMTKAVTVTAALILVERGQLFLDAPVSDYIPEFGAWASRGDASNPRGIVPTVKDLFTMTSGLSYFGGDETNAEREFFRAWEADIDRGEPWGTVGFARKLAALPPAFEPGTRFQYGLSHDVLGAVIEVISGVTLEDFCRRELFGPLKMRDSYWCQSVPVDMRPRLAECLNRGQTPCLKNAYIAAPMPGRPVPGHPEICDPKMFSGGAGLVTTARDYGRFLEFLLNGVVNGADGARGRDGDTPAILKPETLRLLLTPALTAEQRATYNLPGADRCHFGPEYTYSLGMRVLERPDIDPARGGMREFGWSGALGTWFFVDPEDGVWFLYLHQHAPAEHARFIPELRRVFYEVLRHDRNLK